MSDHQEFNDEELEELLNPWSVGNTLPAAVIFGVLAVLLLLGSLTGCHEPQLIQTVGKCGTSCYELGGKPLGQCRAGIWTCTGDDETTARCEGAVGPGEEICDGQDNDCDGLVDEALTRDCSNGCGQGLEICSGGLFRGCTAPGPRQEICNGRDDNCDGQIDEPEALPVEFCYTGPTGSARFGACRPGSNRCEFGHSVCVGEVVPQPETCNMIDDNCDGRIDEGLSPADYVDIVFIVDNSGSMASTIRAVKQAVADFTAAYQTRADIRWGLVVAPDPNAFYDGQVRLFSNFSDALMFNAAMQQMAATGGGEEPTLDALSMLMAPTNPLAMSWRAGSRRVLVLFSDELPQSWLTPAISSQQVNSDISSTGTRVYVFTDGSVQAAWAAVIPTAAGQLRPLTSVAATMEAELKTIVQANTCM